MLTTHNQLTVKSVSEPIVMTGAIKNSEKIEIKRDERGRILPGQGALPGAGRPNGSLDFRTKWFRFIEKVAAQNNLTPDDVEHQLFNTALKEAKAGAFPFYKDIQDRIYGKVVDNVALNATVKSDVPNATPAMLEAIKYYETKNLEQIRQEARELLTQKPYEPSRTSTPASENKTGV